MPPELTLPVRVAACGRPQEIQLIMATPKRKLTAAEKEDRKRRRLEFMTIFLNGKQKRVKRPPSNDMPLDEFILCPE